jgi:hypothetical protein
MSRSPSTPQPLPTGSKTGKPGKPPVTGKPGKPPVTGKPGKPRPTPVPPTALVSVVLDAGTAKTLLTALALALSGGSGKKKKGGKKK